MAVVIRTGRSDLVPERRKFRFTYRTNFIYSFPSAFLVTPKPISNSPMLET